MIVRIRFGRGTSVSRRTGKNARLALGLSTLGNLLAISFGTLGFWRLSQDLGWAADFAFSSGPLSHWQTWLAAAAATQYAAWRLARYGRQQRRTLLQPAAQSAHGAAVGAAAPSQAASGRLLS